MTLRQAANHHLRRRELPGFPEGITGLDLTDRFHAQSLRFSANILTETAASVDLYSWPFKIVSENNTVVETDAVIIATGAIARHLAFSGSDKGKGRFWNRGIFACAVCDDATLIITGNI